MEEDARNIFDNYTINDEIDSEEDVDGMTKYDGNEKNKRQDYVLSFVLACLPLFLFFHLLLSISRVQLLFLGSLHSFNIPQNDELYYPGKTLQRPQSVPAKTESCVVPHDVPGTQTFIQFMDIPLNGDKKLFRTVVTRWAGEQRIEPVVYSDSTSVDYEIDLSVRQGILLDIGQRGYGFSKYVASYTNTLHIAMLRDPIERLQANFVKIRRQFNLPGTTLEEVVANYNEYLRMKTQLHDEIEAIQPFNLILNQQVDYMCGYDCVSQISSSPLTGKEKEDYMRYSRQKRLDRALHNLNHTEIIGIYGKKEEFIYQLGFYVPFFRAYTMKTTPTLFEETSATRISEASRKTLRELMYAEYILFERALVLSKERTNRAIACEEE